MSTGIQDWLYPINSASDYRLGGIEAHQSDLVTRENLWESLLANPNEIADWHLSSGFRLMRPDDRLWIVDTQPPRGIVAAATALRVYETSRKTWSVDLTWNIPLTKKLIRDPILKERYGQTAQTVCRADDATRRVLREWLGGRGAAGGPPKAKALAEEAARTRVLREIAVRRGQAPFRAELLRAYRGACAISGETCAEVLEAAHIVPYADGGHSHLSNGVLLRADMHTLFDLHLLTITERGRVKVSSSLKDTDYAHFDGRKARLPGRPSDRPSGKLLRQHAALLLPT